MSYVYRALIGVFLTALIFSLIGTLYYYEKINSVYEDEITYVFDDDPKYHFSVILEDDDNIYWQEFKEGAYEAAKANNAAIELNYVVGGERSMTALEYIDIATMSKNDGIIVVGDNSDEQAEAINRATDDEVAVVVVGQESIMSNKYSFVGTNFYEYGIQAGKLVSQLGFDKEKVNVAVILSSQDFSDDVVVTSQSDIMMNGLKSIIENEVHIDLVSTLYRKSNLLGAEDLTRNILNEHEEVNVIFCTNAKDTEAAARVIIEKNLVGKVNVIGTGITGTIKNHINKGVVYGTVDRNGYIAGYRSIEFLCNNQGHIYQPSYVDIDIDIYTNINIGTYEKGINR